MVNATSVRQHPNAPLTVEGRRRMVRCVVERGWTVEATAARFQVDAKTVDVPWSGVCRGGVRDAVGPPCNPQRVH